MLKFLVTTRQWRWWSVGMTRQAAKTGQRYFAVMFAKMLTSSIGVVTPWRQGPMSEQEMS
jgi:hypothetical protein